VKVPDIKVTPPGPKAREVIERDKKYMATTTKSAPVVIKRGLGAIVEDVDGNLLIDFASGISVLNVGLSHPKVVGAIRKQAGEFTHFAGTDYYYDVQTQLAKKLAEITPGKHPKKTFFANSGAEGNEAAIKIAKYYKKRQMFLAFLGGFHGRSQGALALTASKAKQRSGFFPAMPGVVHVPFAYCFRCPYKLTYPSCDLHCASIIEDLYLKTIAPPEDVAGIFVEPVQGEGGYIVPPPGWLDRIGKIAKDNDFLFIADEVQSGFGRTGKMWGIEYSKVIPNIMVLAKSLGGGMPIGVAVFDAKMDFPMSGQHSNTYGGNPVAAASSLAVIDVIESEGLVARSAKLGAHMAKRLDEMKDAFEFIGDRRGLGMMQATEFVKDRRTNTPDPRIRDAIEKDAYEHGLILLTCGDSGMRYIPALNIEENVLDAGLDVLEGCFKRAAT
jgi:4-aminobutyrate aminotransferase